MKAKLKRRKDGRFACRYHGQWFYSTVSADDAIKQRDDFIRAQKRGFYFVKDYADAWLTRSRPDVAPSTMTGLRKHLDKLLSVVGELPLSDVLPSDIKEVYSTQYNGLSNSYIKAGKQLFSALFDSAVADGLILSNPARDRSARPHKGTTGGHRAITERERQWINTLCLDHRTRPAVMAMLYAGLRPQEVKAFDVDRDVDFDRETVSVRQTAHIDPNNAQKYAFSGKGKTARANRTIPLLPPLKAALNGKHGLLITSAAGEPVTRTTWRVAWNSYVSKMEEEINGSSYRWRDRSKQWVTFDVTPYDLRHSFATFCRDQQPPVEIHTVIKWMGHADAQMILKIYDEVTDGREDAEASRLKMAFGSQNGSQEKDEHSGND